MSKLDTNQICSCMLKTLKLQEWIVKMFFPNDFLKTKCAPFLLKIGEGFNIDDQKGKMTYTNDFFNG